MSIGRPELTVENAVQICSDSRLTFLSNSRTRPAGYESDEIRSVIESVGSRENDTFATPLSFDRES